MSGRGWLGVGWRCEWLGVGWQWSARVCTCEWQPRSSQRSAKFSVPSVPPVMYTVWNMLTSVTWSWWVVVVVVVEV